MESAHHSLVLASEHRKERKRWSGCKCRVTGLDLRELTKKEEQGESKSEDPGQVLVAELIYNILV